MLDRDKLIEAFENFRRKLIRLGAAFIALTAIGYWQSPRIAAVLQGPSALPLVYYAPAEAFLTNLKLGVFAAIFVLTPAVFFLAWDSFAFYVTPYSRRYAAPVVSAASLLFIGGAYLCYAVVLPFGLTFLLGFGGDVAEPQLSVERYFSFVLVTSFAFGAFFELPLVMLLLGRTGLVNAALLGRYRRYAILAIVCLAAIVTPTTDAYTLALMAGPLIVLYEVSIVLVRAFGRTPQR
ncbi:MAG TPA: twin-arginine translocase subunit TatC [Alphaproteobacteria bacterium]|nr:twin-arginine translocase subunit TatC [Alphaproteobacteria bacterium]